MPATKSAIAVTLRKESMSSSSSGIVDAELALDREDQLDQRERVEQAALDQIGLDGGHLLVQRLDEQTLDALA